MNNSHSAIAIQPNPNGITPGGRLTGTSGTPFNTANTNNISTLYYTPYLTGWLPLYINGRWKPFEFSETSLSLSGLTASTNYDIYGYYDSGSLALETLAWSSSGAGTSTRATALAYDNGYLVKSGDNTRLYLGTIRTTSTTGETENSISKRFIWNYYNRRHHTIHVSIGSSHTYNGAERLWNNAEYAGEFVIGTQDTLTSGFFRSQQTSTVTFYIRLNVVGGPEMGVKNSEHNVYGYYSLRTGYYLPIGWNKLFPTEYAGGTGTLTFFELNATLEM